MNIFRIVLKITFLSIILLNFSCSSINQNTENQDLEVTKVEPLSPTNQDFEITTKSVLPTPKANPNVKRTNVENEITDEDIFQGRDISQYNKGDTSNCNSYKCIERKMRSFIWEHWKNKKQGYISHNLQGIDVSFTDHVFIEPNEVGDWKISWRVERHQVSHTFEQFIDDFVGISSVEKVSTNSKKDRWKLVFKNKDGDVIKTL